MRQKTMWPNRRLMIPKDYQHGNNVDENGVGHFQNKNLIFCVVPNLIKLLKTNH